MNRTLNPNYPDETEIDAWLEGIWETMKGVKAEVTDVPGGGMLHQYGVRHPDNRFLRFRVPGMDDFYGYWQPAPSQPAPLVVPFSPISQSGVSLNSSGYAYTGIK